MQLYRNHITAGGVRLNEGELRLAVATEHHSDSYQSVGREATGFHVRGHVSYGVSDNLTVGANIGLGRDKLMGNGNSKLKGTSTYASAYALTSRHDWTLTTGVAYKQSALNGQRDINNGYDAHEFATKVKPQVWSVFAHAKHEVPLSDALSYEPSVGVAYNHTHMGAINETGLGGLQVAKYRDGGVEMSLGQALKVRKALAVGELSVVAHADYTRQAKSKALSAQFKGGQAFAIQTENNPNQLNLGLSLQYQSKGGLKVKAGASVDTLRKSGNSWNMGLGVQYDF